MKIYVPERKTIAMDTEQKEKQENVSEAEADNRQANNRGDESPSAKGEYPEGCGDIFAEIAD